MFDLALILQNSPWQFYTPWIVSAHGIKGVDPLTGIPVYFLLSFFTLVGLIVGSFGNSVVYRAPLKQVKEQLSPRENLDSKRSYTPCCLHPIAWYDNIPLFSWLALKGKCRYCKAPIPSRYPALEAAGATLGALSLLALGPSLPLLFLGVAGFSLLWASTISLKYELVPLSFMITSLISSAGFAISFEYHESGAISLFSLACIVLGAGVAASMLANTPSATRQGAMIGVCAVLPFGTAGLLLSVLAAGAVAFKVKAPVASFSVAFLLAGVWHLV